MNMRTLLLLGVALATAGGTAFLAKSWLESERASIKPQVVVEKQELQAAMVLVADHDLPTGTFIKPEHLRWHPWPEDGLSDEYTIENEQNAGDSIHKRLQGAVVRSRLLAGQPITAKALVHPGERGFLAAVLDPGMRAVSVPIDAATGIAGLVFPGDWVDVILTLKMTVKDQETEENEQRYFAETLITDIRVLALDQSVENPDGTARVAKTATLEVTPKQAEKVAIGLEMGELSLSLHSLAQEEVEFGPDTIQLAGGPGGPTPLHPNGRAGINGKQKNSKKRSYTLDMDVYYMLGDPRGLQMKGAGAGVDVLRGSEAESVRF